MRGRFFLSVRPAAQRQLLVRQDQQNEYDILIRSDAGTKYPNRSFVREAMRFFAFSGFSKKQKISTFRVSRAKMFYQFNPVNPVYVFLCDLGALCER